MPLRPPDPGAVGRTSRTGREGPLVRKPGREGAGTRKKRKKNERGRAHVTIALAAIKRIIKGIL